MSLVELRIVGLGVLRSVRLPLAPGFCVLTGETGSGKSLCIAALRLALGHRLDLGALAADASVAAVFDVVPDSVASLLRAHGITLNGEVLTVSREVREGRSTCRIDGSLVPLALLRAVGEDLVEVTAQGESHRLLSASWQRSLVDAAGGSAIADQRRVVAAAFARWRAAVAALADAEASRARQRVRIEEAERLAGDLAPLDLRPGELDDLTAEATRLRQATRLAEVASALADACADGDEGGAADLLARAVVRGARVAGVDPVLDELLAEADQVVRALRELATAARRHLGRLAADEGRLAEVEDRLETLGRVTRRFGTVERAIALLEEATAVLGEAADGELARSGLAAAVEEAEAELAAAAERLRELRLAAAERLEEAAGRQLHALGLPRARVRVLLHSVPDGDGVLVGDQRLACDAEGIDRAEMRVAVGAHGVPLPLDALSGGELSRLALALRSVVAAAGDSPTLVLDEIDAGIGGHTAARVGEVLAAIAAGEHGNERQVLVVTHRPEIAARAAHHLVVRRREDSSDVQVVSGKERATEIARLMSGRATAAALARAYELLEEADARAPTPVDATPTIAVP